ncbi:hypothetical protein [Saccharopolyspora sp. NPDC002376]
MAGQAHRLPPVRRGRAGRHLPGHLGPALALRRRALRDDDELRRRRPAGRRIRLLPPAAAACNRVQSNGYFRVTLRGDQIVSAQFGIGSRIEGGRQRHLLSQEFPRGLTFLTEEVRRAVTDRIEDCRRSGTSFAGIVAGTVVIVDARWGPAPRDGADYATYLDVQIGAPLAGTYY